MRDLEQEFRSIAADAYYTRLINLGAHKRFGTTASIPKRQPVLVQHGIFRSRRGRFFTLSQCSTFNTLPMCRAYVPLRFLPHGLGTTRTIRTVTTGTGGNMPLLRTNR